MFLLLVSLLVEEFGIGLHRNDFGELLMVNDDCFYVSSHYNY